MSFPRALTFLLPGPGRSRLGLTGWALSGLSLAALMLGCTEAEEPQPAEAPALASGSEGQAASSEPGEPEAAPAPGVGRGLFVRRKGKDRFRYVAWESEEETNRIFRTLRRYGGGEVHFTPGTYVIEQGLYLSQTPDLKISGGPDVRFEFAPPPEVLPLTTQPVLAGDTELHLDDASGMHVGWEYQLYAPDLDSTRILEFTVASVEGNLVRLKSPAVYMPRITEIPAGSRVFEEINFIKVFSCPDLVLEGLHVDGLNRGTVRGHTLYGGIYASGQNERQERPTVRGLTIRGCSFRGLKGRALAAYGIGDVRVSGCSFHDIYAQAMEIDHFSSGTIVNNLVDGAEVGVMLNDAFESVVEGNVFLRCGIGVRILRLFPQEWINRGNTVRDNRIGYCEHGVVFNDNLQDGKSGTNVTGNYVIDNHFVGIPPLERVVNWRGNTVSGSTHE